MKTKTTQRLLVAICILLSSELFAQQTEHTYSEVKAEMAERITKAMKKNNVMGVSVIVVSPDEVLWKEHFGLANVEQQIPVTDETRFALGSVTKVFTATSVMQLQAQGLLDIDKPLKTYLPQFNIKGENSHMVTPRNVMTHHSGLPSDIFKGMFTNQPEDYKEVVNYINREQMAGVPNQMRAYSNPGYSLLGHVIYQVSGMEYPDYVKAHVLDPLEMSATGFDNHPMRSGAYDADGKSSDDGRLRDIPAGGVWSNADNMSKFVMAWLQRSPNLMEPAGYAEMLSQQHTSSQLNAESRYGLGWNMNEKPYVGDIFFHTGTTRYFNAAMAIAPEANLGVVILTNSENGGRVYNLYKDLLDGFAKASGAEKRALSVTTDLGNKKRIQTSPEALNTLTGIYVKPGIHINAYEKRGKLFIRLQGIRAELITVGEQSYVLKPILLGIIPVRLSEGRIMIEEIEGQMVMTQVELNGRKELLASKYYPAPISDAWKDRLGAYEIVNKLPGEMDYFGDFNLVEVDGLLLLTFKQLNNDENIRMVVEQVDDTYARIAGLGRYSGQAIQVHADHLTAFGLELKKLTNE